MSVLRKEWWQGEVGSRTPSAPTSPSTNPLLAWWKRRRLWQKALIVVFGLSLVGKVLPHPPGDVERVRTAIGEDAYQRIGDFVAERNAHIESTKRYVRNSMKDPSSTEFGRVWSPTKGVVCGYARGRNAFGVMAGWTRFVNDGGSVWLGDKEHLGEATWNGYCR